MIENDSLLVFVFDRCEVQDVFTKFQEKMHTFFRIRGSAEDRAETVGRMAFILQEERYVDR